MLQNYEKKKKAISSELHILKSGEKSKLANPKKSLQKKPVTSNKITPHVKNENDDSFGRKSLPKDTHQKDVA